MLVCFYLLHGKPPYIQTHPLNLYTVPETPPQDVEVVPFGSRKLKITWLPPSGKGVEHIIYYKIIYKQLPEQNEQDDNSSDNKNGSKPISNGEIISLSNFKLEKIYEINSTNRDNLPYKFILTNLEYWTRYQIRIIAGTNMGDGPASWPIVVRTEEDGKKRNDIF